MIRKSTILASVFAAVVVAGTAVPQTARAGAPERAQYRQCLSVGALKPNETVARSECMWEHWSYMASYGP
jgi:hypothetical protein